MYKVYVIHLSKHHFAKFNNSNNYYLGYDFLLAEMFRLL